MILWIFIVLGLLLISYLGYKNWTGRAGEKYLIDLIRQQNGVIEELTNSVNLGIRIHRENIEAMEEGMTEQEENYEMQFLTFEERLVEKDAHIVELEARLEHHDRECLPILHETRWQALSGSVENA